MNEVLGNDRTVNARKKHRCSLCKMVITPGTKYIVREGVDAGVFWRMKMHEDCRACGNDMLEWQQWEAVEWWSQSEFLEIKKEWIANGRSKPEPRDHFWGVQRARVND